MSIHRRNKARCTIFNLEIAGLQFRADRPWSFGLVLYGCAEEESFDYLHHLLLNPATCEALYTLVDLEGLVVCKNLRTRHPSYREVRGRSSRGRLSPGEYYHHDGCSLPHDPRVVEIRCPHQDVSRSVATAVAPFPRTVVAMIQALPPGNQATRLRRDCDQLDRGGDVDHWVRLQGLTNRVVRRTLDSESARRYFLNVDHLAAAYVAPWDMGESRLIANANPGRTMQHRRAYQQPHRGGQANGRLVKRWPAEELLPSGATPP